MLAHTHLLEKTLKRLVGHLAADLPLLPHANEQVLDLRCELRARKGYPGDWGQLGLRWVTGVRGRKARRTGDGIELELKIKLQVERV